MNDITIIVLVAIIAPCATVAFIVAQTGSTDGIAEILQALAEILRALFSWGNDR
ncbi:hypothetical protein H7I77_05685 [Mycolicibacterium novocastrense]|uniref:Uncharacterized protein n=1 Tax=Mycolicibacterium novocastrense TaxID=59813 RepID=A0AAW5SGQ0_MYCNV|nr:hypothetical protein [Mycolicibacterium novocastrense]MCV7022845.1 hypothetical protein [Mycolicibacterium novocastrense]GAT10420.1 putative uncharacterized protein [Mycolicibacterium novocastrense]